MVNTQRSLSPGKWAAALCAGLLLLAAVAAGLLIGSSRFPRLEFGDQRITREEYLSAMYRARNQVLSDHAAGNYGKDEVQFEKLYKRFAPRCRFVQKRAAFYMCSAALLCRVRNQLAISQRAN